MTKEERKKERKKKKKERERKKRGYIYKKGRVRKEQSETEPASSTHYGITLQQKKKTFHRLLHLTLERLQILAITLIRCQLCIVSLAAPTHTKKRNAPLMTRGFSTPPCLAHAHMQRKETYFAPPIPNHCANGSCHRGLWFLHTTMCTT